MSRSATQAGHIGRQSPASSRPYTTQDTGTERAERARSWLLEQCKDGPSSWQVNFGPGVMAESRPDQRRFEDLAAGGDPVIVISLGDGHVLLPTGRVEVSLLGWLKWL